MGPQIRHCPDGLKTYKAWVTGQVLLSHLPGHVIIILELCSEKFFLPSKFYSLNESQCQLHFRAN